MINVFGFAMSPYTSRVLLACKTAGLQHDLAPPPEGFKSPAHLALNPFGKIPATSDGEIALHESLATVDYLYRAYIAPDQPLADAALDLQYALVIDHHVQVPVSAVFREWIGGGKDRAKIVNDVKAIDAGLAVLDQDKQFTARAMGNPGRTECCAAPAFIFLEHLYERFELEPAFAKYGAVSDYWQKIRSIPEISDHLAIMNGMLIKRLDG